MQGGWDGVEHRALGAGWQPAGSAAAWPVSGGRLKVPPGERLPADHTRPATPHHPLPCRMTLTHTTLPTALQDDRGRACRQGPPRLR